MNSNEPAAEVEEPIPIIGSPIKEKLVEIKFKFTYDLDEHSVSQPLKSIANSMVTRLRLNECIPTRESAFPLMFVSNGLDPNYYICPTSCDYMGEHIVICDKPTRQLIIEDGKLNNPLPLYGYAVTVFIRSAFPNVSSLSLNSDYGCLRGQFGLTISEGDRRPQKYINEYVMSSFHPEPTCDQAFDGLVGTVVEARARTSPEASFFCAREARANEDRSKLWFKSKFNLTGMSFKVGSMFKYGPFYYDGEQFGGEYRCTKIQILPSKSKLGDMTLIHSVRVDPTVFCPKTVDIYKRVYCCCICCKS